MIGTLQGLSFFEHLCRGRLYIHSHSLTWKWTMAPGKTIFHYKQVVFHFHVSESNDIYIYITLYNSCLHDDNTTMDIQYN